MCSPCTESGTEKVSPNVSLLAVPRAARVVANDGPGSQSDANNTGTNGRSCCNEGSRLFISQLELFPRWAKLPDLICGLIIPNPLVSTACFGGLGCQAQQPSSPRALEAARGIGFSHTGLNKGLHKELSDSGELQKEREKAGTEGKEKKIPTPCHFPRLMSFCVILFTASRKSIKTALIYGS